MNRPTYSHPSFFGWIGVAEVDITPPLEIYARNWGAALHDQAQGLHQPLKATVLTLQTASDQDPLVLIGADGGWWRAPDDEWLVRGTILEGLGLEATRLIFNLSHTHAGPNVSRADAAKPGGEFVEPYLQEMSRKCLEAARHALQTARPASLEWHEGICELATNRDLPDPDAPRYICGFNPQGHPDQTLLVGRVCDEKGQIVATIANYACHPTTLAWENVLISPDFVGETRELVGMHTKAPLLFLQGASGELAPRRQYTGDVAVAEANGRILGFSVLALLEAMQPPRQNWSYQGPRESGAPLAIWHDTPASLDGRLEATQIEVELPLRAAPSKEEFARQLAECQDRVLAERLHRQFLTRAGLGEGSSIQAALYLWRVGGALVVATPNEAYSVFQTELRAAFPDKAVIVMNVSNGTIGYLPPAPLYDENIYAVWQTPFERGCLEKLIAEAKSGLENLPDV